MKTRTVVILSGETFEVPANIQRIDLRATHGWQIRYAGTLMFSDLKHGGGSPARSLELATKELLKRIASMQAPTGFQRAPCDYKSSNLPPGIHGPVLRLKKGKPRDCSLAVLIPRFGNKPLRRNVYIGTPNTYTIKRFEAALVRAIEMRAKAEEVYRRAATCAKRADALAYKAKVKEAARQVA